MRHARAFHQGRATAKRLRGDAVAALDALGADAPPEAWRAFLAEQDLGNALRILEDPALDEILGAAALPPTGLRSTLRGALAGAAAAHDAAAGAAERHFGIDEGVFAPDPGTLVVELEAPIPYFLELVAFYPTFPVPRVLVEAHPDDWFLPERIVSNGPFVLERWRVGDRIRLRRNDGYWGRDAIGVETIDALPIENPTTAMNLYLTGELDWLQTYPNDLADVLRERADHYSGPAFIVYYYRLNTTRPPLDDPRVREAIGLAIDRETIVRDILRMGQQPARHLVPPGVPGYEPPPSALGFDPERARTLLAEAGYPGGEGVREIGILYNTNDVHKQVAELIADQLRRHLGIPAQPYNQEWQSYLATVRQGEYDVARAGWIGDYLDPNTFLDLWVTNGGNNQTGWGDPDYDRWIRAAADIGAFARQPSFTGLAETEKARALVDAWRRSEDPEARREVGARLRLQLLREAEGRLVQQGFPVIPIYFYTVYGLVRPEVGGFYSELVDPDGTRRPNLQDLHPLRGIRDARERRGGPMIAALVLSASLAAIAAIAWLPLGVTRWLGAGFLATIAVLIARHPLGDLAALAIGVAGLAAAHRWAGPWVLRRVSFTVPSLLLLILATTWLMYLAPGNPFAQERALEPQVEAALRAQYGVPESPLAFFGVYMERLLWHGDLGPALKVQGRSVVDLLLPALPVSLALGSLALTFAVALGLALGVRAGLRPGSAADAGSMGLALIGISLPNFVIGAGLLVVFSLALGWLPVAGWGGPAHAVLPAVTLALGPAATIARLVRSEIIDVMQQDFVRTARAKGLPERIVVLRHALRTAVLPVVSYLGPAAAGILTGSFVVETLFGIPGMGQWFVKGAINRDYSVVLGTALFYGGLVTAFNLAVDLALNWLDPRGEEST